MMTDGDIRMLGARDGFAHALIWVRDAINRIDGAYASRINPRHIRKRAARIAKSHAETKAAYDLTRKEIA